MRIFLQAVEGYAGTQPIHYTAGTLADYELEPERDLLQLSRSVQFRTTVFQARSDFFRVGKLTARLNAARGEWIPGSGWLQSDRDHLLTVTTDARDILWRGYATGVKMTPDAGAEWTFASLYDRLDDVQVAGDEDPLRTAIPAQEIVDEVAAQLPDLWPAGVDASGWADVFRPDQAESARDYVAAMLTAEGLILVPDGSGDLEVREIGPRQAAFDPATGLTVRSADLIRIALVDPKRYMYNTITYEHHGADGPIRYTGNLAVYLEPGNYHFRFGRREIRMDFEHLSEADAAAAAEAWQGRLLRPRRRATVRLPEPDRRVLLLDRVRLELDDVADIPIPLWGDFVVTGLKVDLVQELLELELEDLVESLY